jgi:hypothetical protein
LGVIEKGASSTKTTFLLIKDINKTKFTDLKSSSEYVKVKSFDAIKNDDGTYKIPIDVTVLPGIAPGKFRETITAYSDDSVHKQASLRIIGSRLGNVIVMPEQIRLFTYDSLDSKNITAQKFTMKNDLAGRSLEIMDINDQDKRLDISVDTLEEGSVYELTATLKEEFITTNKGSHSGFIVVQTNDPEQTEIKVRYQIIHRK